jgi:hypothetical protein|nr:hypothetical protein [Phenylobacterium sp.]
MTWNSGLLGAVFATLLGLWWAAAPNNAIGFYRSLGNRQFERAGPGLVRAFGFVLLVMVAIAGVLVVAQRLTR